MVIEYILLLLVSVIIILSPFMTQKGPVTMMGKSGPVLGMKVERALVTGHGFFERKGRKLDWRRR